MEAEEMRSQQHIHTHLMRNFSEQKPSRKKNSFHCGNSAAFPFNFIVEVNCLLVLFIVSISASANVVSVSYSRCSLYFLPSHFNGDFCCLIPSRAQKTHNMVKKKLFGFAFNHKRPAFYGRSKMEKFKNIDFPHLVAPLGGNELETAEAEALQHVWVARKSLIFFSGVFYLITANYDPFHPARIFYICSNFTRKISTSKWFCQLFCVSLFK